MNVNNEGIFVAGNVQGSNLAMGANRDLNAQNSGESSSDLEIIRAVLGLLRDDEARARLPSESMPEIDDAVEVLGNAESTGETRTPSARNALRTVMRLAGDLIRGAGGNALWEGVQAIVS